MEQEQINALVKASHDAKNNSYSPYSKFRVGVALLCQDGTFIKGCNVENVSLGLTVCAERTAMVKAVSEGHNKFKAIAVASDMADTVITPCGACRQFLIEFGVDWDVYMTKPDYSYKILKTEQIDFLVKASHDAKNNSYSPYSKFCVGAALLCQDGTVIKGCNVENASYGLSICAERTAMVKTVSEGRKKFKAIAVASDMADSVITPCGACRQFLVEFGVDWDMYVTKPDYSYKILKTGDMLPLCFVPDSLEEERISNSA